MPETLVLLPGMNCSPRLWGDVVAHIRSGPEEGNSTAVDMRLEPLDRPSLDEQVDALLDRLPKRFALGGLSLGAIVAMAIHRRAPERVTGLLLVATNARPPTAAQRTAWHRHLHQLECGASPRDIQIELLPLLLGADPAPAVRQLALEVADDVGVEALEAQLRLQLTRVDERPGLRTLTRPCSVVAGAEDRICGIALHTEIARLVPRSELVVISGAPHLVPLSNPQQLAEVVTGWLARVRD